MFVSFLIHWILFIPAFIFKTERFFDLTGAIANTTVVSIALYYKYMHFSPILDYRSIIIQILVSLWAIRLGAFLFYRVLSDGKDRRFDEIKISFLKFLFTWNLSAFWVFITTCCALTVISSKMVVVPDYYMFFGIFLWVAGFLVETIADFQKRKFKSISSNKDQFINSGLWSISRHPNYLGEIILWSGIAVIGLPVLSRFEYITLISPIFVYLLLTRISGINLLEEIADKKWGNLDSYNLYKKTVPVLFPNIFRK
tara:strand:- start:193 stop:957 length:765 start_codon:yes stop_codon:yes gene_type:complete